MRNGVVDENVHYRVKSASTLWSVTVMKSFSPKKLRPPAAWSGGGLDCLISVTSPRSYGDGIIMMLPISRAAMLMCIVRRKSKPIIMDCIRMTLRNQSYDAKSNDARTTAESTSWAGIPVEPNLQPGNTLQVGRSALLNVRSSPRPYRRYGSAGWRMDRQSGRSVPSLPFS